MSLKQVWWYDYKTRKREIQTRPKMSFEMIVRKAFCSTLKEYVDNCSVAGVRQMCDRKLGYKQRAIYIILFCAMLFTVFFFLRYIWFGSLIKPLIVTMESSTYPISNIDFPAVALCNINRISKKALTTAVRKSPLYLSLQNKTRLDELEWFFLQSGRLLDYSYDPALNNHPFLYAVPTHVEDTLILIDKMKDTCFAKEQVPTALFMAHCWTRVSPTTVEGLEHTLPCCSNADWCKEQLAPNCDDMLIKCAWAGVEVNCSSVFSTKRTVHGHCCAFNYVLGYDSSGQPYETIASIKKQILPGRYHGLNVVLDPMVDDYAYSLYNMVGIEVLIFDPTHFADPSGGRVIQRNVQPDQAVYLELKSIKQIATAEVRKYPYSVRKCLFHDENMKNWMYSYSTCIVRCRIKTVQSLCKCTPYYLPSDRQGAVCTINDLRCLNKHKEKLLYIYPKDAVNTEGLETELQDSLICPNCMPDCELTQHFTKHSKIPLADHNSDSKQFKSNFLKDLNVTKKCMLSIYQSTTDGVLNRLDVVSYWFEILSNVGGFCGVLLGISIITILELFYFFLIRFPEKAINFYLNE